MTLPLQKLHNIKQIIWVYVCVFSLIKRFLCCFREKKELKRQMDRRRTEKINQAKTKEKHLAEEYDP